MTRRRVFLWTAAAGGYIGIGMLLGYILDDQSNNTPLWVGGLLTLLGAILLGMFISSRSIAAPATQSEGSERHDAEGTAG